MISTKTSALKRNWYNNPIKEYVVLLVFVLLFFNMFSFSYNKTLSAIADVSFLLCGLLSVMRIFLSKKLSHTDYGITLCFGAILLLKAISGILLGQYLTIVKVALRLSICEMLIVFIPKEKKILYFSRIFNILFFVFIVLGFVDYF